MLIRRIAAVGAAVLFALVFFAPGAGLVHAQAPCGLIQDCGFDNFYGDSGAGSGPWKIRKISGSASIGLHPTEGWPKGPSVWFQSTDAPFDAAIYQQVAVTPGAGYQFTLAWGVVNLNGAGWQPDNQVNRELGIDPNGGTDPTAGSVQWTAPYLGKGKFASELQMSAYAQASTLTVFIRVINPYTDRHVDVFVDSAELEVNTGMPPITVTAPTAPPSPPTNPPPATARATQVPTVIALAPTETDAPTETPAPSATDEPSATAEPSDTPTRIPTRIRRLTPTPAADQGNSRSVLALSIVGATGVIGLVLAVVFFALAFVYWRRAKQ